LTNLIKKNLILLKFCRWRRSQCWVDCCSCNC